MSTRKSQRLAVWSKIALLFTFALLIAGAIGLPSSSALGHGNLVGTPTPSGGGSGKIAFTSHRGDRNDEIYVMDADGSDQRNLTNNRAEDSKPAWSPDGKRIAFASDRDGHAQIYVMDADGKNPRRLTNNKGANRYAVWQPVVKSG